MLPMLLIGFWFGNLWTLSVVVSIGLISSGEYLLAATTYSAELKIVAQVDGKVFFAGNEAKWGVDVAKKVCEDVGLDLPEIQTLAEWTALQNANLTDKYWTAARDHITLNMFAWAESGEEISLTRANYTAPVGYRERCLIYQKAEWPNTSLHVLVPESCEERALPMCQATF